VADDPDPRLRALALPRRPTAFTAADAQRSPAGRALQDVLVELLDLELLGRHLGWNVAGAGAGEVRSALAALGGECRRLSDAVAGRAAALGQAPDGQAATVAGGWLHPLLSEGPVPARAAAAGVAARLDAVAARVEHAAATVTGDEPTRAVLAAAAFALAAHRAAFAALAPAG